MVSAQLLQEARALAPEDRWALIEELQQSLQDDAYEPIDVVADQMDQRFRDYQAGRIETIAWDEFQAILNPKSSS